MARYYRRRYRTIVKAPKKKWASNIISINGTADGDNNGRYFVKNLVQNSSELALPTPVIIKAGNIKVQGDCSFQANSGVVAEFSFYVVFVPQGVAVTSSVEAGLLIYNHPEWIMAWKYVSANHSSSLTPVDNDTFSFSSRLKRNLNSGDTIKLICLVEGQNITSATIKGKCQFWTCAN